MAQSWYNAILAGTANLLPRVKEELRTKQPGMDVKHVGWITEQVRLDKESTLPKCSKFKFFSTFTPHSACEHKEDCTWVGRGSQQKEYTH